MHSITSMALHQSIPPHTFTMSHARSCPVALLFLNGGRWNGDQIISRGLRARARTPHSNADRGLEYGYLWWTADALQPSLNELALPSGILFRVGNGGQFAFVIPKDDLVVVERTDRGRPLKPPKTSRGGESGKPHSARGSSRSMKEIRQRDTSLREIDKIHLGKMRQDTSRASWSISFDRVRIEAPTDLAFSVVLP